MNFKNIRWLGPERELPGYGTIQPGEHKRLPMAVANSYIRQGLAVELPRKPKKEGQP